MKRKRRKTAAQQRMNLRSSTSLAMDWQLMRRRIRMAALDACLHQRPFAGPRLCTDSCPVWLGMSPRYEKNVNGQYISFNSDQKIAKHVINFLQILQHDLAQINLLTVLWTVQRETLRCVWLCSSPQCWFTALQVKETSEPNNQAKLKPCGVYHHIKNSPVLFLKCRAGALWHVPPATSPNCFIHQELEVFITIFCCSTPLFNGHKQTNRLH